MDRVDFTSAIPQHLKEDDRLRALGKIIAEELRNNIEAAKKTIIYPKIDALNERALDILAQDMHLDWYDFDSPPSAKRDVVKSGIRTHRQSGTRGAVERIIGIYFGSGVVREWQEYGGAPFHFKIISGNPSVTNERIDSFMRILNAVKRKSAHLDAILIALTGEMSLYTGMILKDSSREIHCMGRKEAD